MNYYLSADSFYSQDELAHYGILGMKWGSSQVSERRWLTYRYWEETASN